MSDFLFTTHLKSVIKLKSVQPNISLVLILSLSQQTKVITHKIFSTESTQFLLVSHYTD